MERACPRCGLVHLDDAVECDCGFRFDETSVLPSLSTDSEEGLYPVIRCRPLFGGKREFLRITPDAVTVGHVKGPLTEGLLASFDILGPRHSGDLETVAADEILQVARERVGYLSESALWVRYTLYAPRKRYHFRVCDREAANVDYALEVMLGDRLDPDVPQRMSGTEKALIGLGVLAVGCVAMVWLSWVFLLVGIVIGVVTGVVALSMRSVRNNSPLAAGRPARRERKGKAGKAPFRSPVLGWLLKIVGLAWILLVLFAPSPFEYLEQAGGSSVSTLQYLYWGLLLIGLTLMYRGYQMCLRTFGPNQHPDPRPPFVYLRGFDDDGRGTFQPNTSLAKLHGLESP